MIAEGEKIKSESTLDFITPLVSFAERQIIDMKFPKKLEKGACIGLVACSSFISEERLAACITFLKEKGYQLKVADNITANKAGYMAGEETVRAQWLNRMFADPDVDAIFCVRGGDGSNRMISGVDLDVVRANPKIFVGYSDTTTMLNLFASQCGLVTFHGPMVSSNMVDAYDDDTRIAFEEALTAEEEYWYHEPEAHPLVIAQEGCGKVSAPLAGGNLELIGTSIGTPYEVDTDGKILFIEEVHGHIGNLDRTVFQLRDAGKFDKVKGVLLGQFTDMEIDETDYGPERVIMDAIRSSGRPDADQVPVITNIQSGHGRPMITLPIGAMCEMDTRNRTIRFQVER